MQVASGAPSFKLKGMVSETNDNVQGWPKKIAPLDKVS